MRTEPALAIAPAAAPAPLIRARGLALGYGTRPVLTGIDLEVSPADFWCLVGPNGSGKSTFLRGTLGLLRPLAGSLEVAAELGGGRRVGFVPQRCEIKRTLPLTVREPIDLGLTGTGLRGSPAAAAVEWSLERVGLAAMGDRDFWSLSGGQRQRALIARALVRRPRLLIVDEPTSGLDLAAEEAVLTLVEDLHRAEGLTILFVTHALALAARFATHVAVFTGSSAVVGPRRAVLRGDILGAAFGVPIDVTHDADGRSTVHLGCSRAAAPTKPVAG